MGGAARRDRVANLLEPVTFEAGFDLEEVALTPAGKRRVLRVVVDRDEGVTADDTSDLTHEISTVLDESDVMGNAPYVLEVTSPGADRPLTEPRHWRRAIGRLVRVRVSGGDELLGRVVFADSSTVVLDVDGTHRTLTYQELGRGKIQLEFRRSDADSGVDGEARGGAGNTGELPGQDEEGEQWTST